MVELITELKHDVNKIIRFLLTASPICKYHSSVICLFVVNGSRRELEHTSIQDNKITLINHNTLLVQ